MTTKTKSVSLDPKPPIIPPLSPDMDNSSRNPTKPMKKKRKERSDKGTKRNTDDTNITDETKKPKELGLSADAKRFKKLYKPFDEYKKSENWKMQVWPCWNDFEKYEILFWFDGVRYGYKTQFDDASLAVTIGTQYLDSRYKNKSLYQVI